MVVIAVAHATVVVAVALGAVSVADGWRGLYRAFTSLHPGQHGETGTAHSGEGAVLHDMPHLCLVWVHEPSVSSCWCFT